MIKINDLEIKYGDFVAVKNLNLHIEKGEFFTLLGPSGCGKTTTLRTIAGFIEPSKGNIYLEGEDITNLPVEKRELGMVFQSYALFPTMTVRENISYGLKVKKASSSKIEETVSRITKLVQLDEEHLDKNVADLSGGQQQRVAIARALANEPDVVLFDEPMSNLDARLRKELRLEIKRIQENTNMTAIYVTHDQEEALELSTNIAVFNKGVVEQVASPYEIYNYPATEFVCNFIGESNLLEGSVLDVIYKQLDANHSSNKKYYIRPEKLHLDKKENDNIKLKGRYKSHIFQGAASSLLLEVENTDIRISLPNEDTKHISYQNGDELTIYLNSDNILEYEVTK